MKKVLWWGMGILILLTGVVWWQWPKPGVRVVMCDVGQGDAILFMEGFSQLLIDTGPESGGVSTCLGTNMPFWDMFVETVVITHADNDHVGGLDGILRRYRVGNVITSQVAVNRVREIVHNRTNIATSWQGQQWMFGSISGKVLWPPFAPVYTGASVGASPLSNEDTNAQSLVARLQWDNQSVWMAGDADARVEEVLINEGLVEPTTILKVGHHGSASASSESFLRILAPSQAWISVGARNRYGHPASDVLERLSGMKIMIRRTDKEGTFSAK